MKISNTNNPVGGPGNTPIAGSTATQGTQGSQKAVASYAANTPSPESTSESSSQVTLSPAVSQLQNAIAMAGTGEVYDAKQVASIKQAIANGDFKVNPEKIADKLLESVKEMLSSRNSRGG